MAEIINVWVFFTSIRAVITVLITGFWAHFIKCEYNFLKYTPPKTNSLPLNGWKIDYFPLKRGPFGGTFVHFRGCNEAY